MFSQRSSNTASMSDPVVASPPSTLGDAAVLGYTDPTMSTTGANTGTGVVPTIGTDGYVGPTIGTMADGYVVPTIGTMADGYVVPTIGTDGYVGPMNVTFGGMGQLPLPTMAMGLPAHVYKAVTPAEIVDIIRANGHTTSSITVVTHVEQPCSKDFYEEENPGLHFSLGQALAPAALMEAHVFPGLSGRCAAKSNSASKRTPSFSTVDSAMKGLGIADRSDKVQLAILYVGYEVTSATSYRLHLQKGAMGRMAIDRSKKHTILLAGIPIQHRGDVVLPVCPRPSCPAAPPCPPVSCPQCPKPTCPPPQCPKPTCPPPQCPKPTCPEPKCPQPKCPVPPANTPLKIGIAVGAAMALIFLILFMLGVFNVIPSIKR